jgi:hypothetical protein
VSWTLKKIILEDLESHGILEEVLLPGSSCPLIVTVSDHEVLWLYPEIPMSTSFGVLYPDPNVIAVLPKNPAREICVSKTTTNYVIGKLRNNRHFCHLVTQCIDIVRSLDFKQEGDASSFYCHFDTTSEPAFMGTISQIEGCIIILHRDPTTAYIVLCGGISEKEDDHRLDANTPVVYGRNTLGNKIIKVPGDKGISKRIVVEWE